MPLFIEPSALVKGYVDEDGSRASRLILEKRELWGEIFISELSLVEVPSAFGGKVRSGTVPRHRFGALQQTFEADVEHTFHVIPLETPILDRATELIARHHDRKFGAGDAIQVASAGWVTEEFEGKPEPHMGVYHLVAADRGLLGVAKRIGFDTFNPQKDDLQELIEDHRGLGQTDDE